MPKARILFTILIYLFAAAANAATCSPGYFLQLNSTLCMETCVYGGWADTVSGSCQPCATQCFSCTSANSDCTVCAFGYFLQPGQSNCLTTCPVGYYKSYLRRICARCDESCSTCDSASYCSTCNSGYYLQPTSPRCLTSCPSNGYWPDPARNICSPCAFECASCNGPSNSNCSSCNSGYFWHSATNSCETWVPTGFYGETVTNTIAVCDASCITCNGPSNTHCLTCNEGYYLQPDSTTCLSSCPTQRFWKDSQRNLCSPCRPQCSSCTSTSVCTACSPGYFLDSSNSCQIACPAGYYKNNLALTCDPCDSSCKTCSGPTKDECFSCNDGYYLLPSSTTCSTTGPATGYFLNNIGNIASPCAHECLSCTGFTNTECLSCSPGFVLQPPSTCTTSCSSGYYLYTPNNTCLACHKACKSCTGGSSDECSSCTNGYYLQPTGSSCASTCPQYWYWANPLGNICTMCSIECLECTETGSDKCVSCRPGYYMQPNSFSTVGGVTVGLCATSCPDGYYRESVNNTCTSCSDCDFNNNNNKACMDCSDYSMNSQIANSSGLSTGTKIGVIIGGAVLGSIAVILFVCYLKKAMQIKRLMKAYKFKELNQAV